MEVLRDSMPGLRVVRMQREYGARWLKQSRFTIFSAGIIVGALTISIGSRWISTSSALSDQQKTQVESIVRNRLLSDPDLVIAALTKAKERTDGQRAEIVREAIVARRDELMTGPNSPLEDSLKYTVPVVEFFDYSCLHCRAMEPTISALLAGDPHVYLIYKELPILGENSVIASRIALATLKQGKYDEFRSRLMASKAQITEKGVMTIAASLGLNPTKLEADMSESDATIDKNKELARALGIEATPAFVVGGEVLSGEITLSDFKHAIAEEKSHPVSRE
jgi:protein-disulfide isomerase